jgi:hypothetical protein
MRNPRAGIRDELSGTAVEHAILLWATWSTGSFGWGRCTSPAAMLMLAKEVGIAPRGTAPMPEMPAEAAQIDGLVAKLERPLKRPFKIYYLQYAPAEAKARACGFGTDVSKLYRHVRRARLVIAGKFNAPPHFSCKSANNLLAYKARCGFAP